MPYYFSVVGDNVKKIFTGVVIKDRFILINFGLALIINLLLAFLLYTEIEHSGLPIYLHYNVYFGVDLIGDWTQVFILPAAGLFIWIVNLSLAYLLYIKEKILSYFLAAAVLLASVFIFIAGLLVIWINS